MKTRVFLVAFVLFAAAHLAAAQSVTKIVPDGKVHKFEARDRNFWIDGEQTLLVSGEMHFGRVLPEDWETRIKQAKAMGLNTISFYLFWNLCEPEEGKFTFTGMTDVRRVLQLCQQNGMWAILRPGPYCCAEVEYGGIPAWTLRYPNVPIRSTDPKWLEWCRRYIEQVYKQVGDLQVTHGGPLLMVQMDNEFGMISQGNNAYLAELQKIFTGVGFDTQLFTCDPGAPGGQTVEGVLRGPNGYKAGRGGGRGPGRGGAPQPEPAVQYPTFVPEVYTNWFNAWGNPITPRYITIEEITQWTAGLIDANASFNYYVFHGGTTYGFFNGCNEYLPLVNSYDYGAPVDEAGRTTQKYWALRELLSSKLKITPPQPPPEPEVINLPAVSMNESVPLLDTLPAQPTKVEDKPLSMEMLGQSYGFVLYRKKFENGLKGTLVLKKPMDYAIVMVNGKTVGEAFRGYGAERNTIALPETSGAATLDILVYNLGRISVITAPWTQDRASKGLIDGASLDGQDLSGWEMYSLPMDSTSNLSGWKPRVQFGRGGRGGPGAAPGAGAAAHTGPTLYRGTFDVYKLGGTFLDMRNWSFGVVWVNGHNLGRFWDRGAVRSLFVPSHWLKQGQNEIVVLELHDAPPRTAEVTGLASLVSEPAVPFATKDGAPIRLDQPASFGPAGRGGRGARGRGAATAPAIAPATPTAPVN
jgi:beta-galactosidase